MIDIMIIIMILVMYKIKGFGDAHMKVSREQVAEHRSQILAAAARLFRLRGFEEVTVAEVMKDAGLTHGAFYGYFPSKEALIAEAVGHALPLKPGDPGLRHSAAEFADGYLSVRHRDNRANACVFSSLGTETARGSAELRHSMTESVRRRIDEIYAHHTGQTVEQVHADTERDRFFKSHEAAEYGLIDKVIEKH